MPEGTDRERLTRLETNQAWMLKILYAVLALTCVQVLGFHIFDGIVLLAHP